MYYIQSESPGASLGGCMQIVQNLYASLSK